MPQRKWEWILMEWKRNNTVKIYNDQIKPVFMIKRTQLDENEIVENI